MTVDTQKLRDLLDKTIKRAYLLGQDYWRLADSESWSDNRRSNDVQDKFDALHSEAVSVAGAQVSILQDEIERLARACRVAVMALAHASETNEALYGPAYKTVSDALYTPAPPQGEKHDH